MASIGSRTMGRFARAVVAATLLCNATGCGGRRGPIEPARVTADQMRETQEAIARAQGAEAAAPRQDIRPEATDGSR
jgi:predicted small lipoprotein YifL